MTENSIEQEIKKLCSHIKVVMGKLEALEEIDILISRKCENKIVGSLRQYRPLSNINFLISYEEIEREAEIIKSQTNKDKNLKDKIKDLIKKEIAILDTDTLCEHISFCMTLLTKLERKDIVLARKLARNIMNTLMNYGFFEAIDFSMIEDNLLEDMQTLFMQEQAKLTLNKGDNDVKEK